MCHPDDSKIMKTLMARCSEDGSNDLVFIPYGLTQISTNMTYRRQIVLHNNFLAAMAVVPIHGISKTAMKEKLEGKLQKILELKSIEETHLAERNLKWLIVTSKQIKTK